MQCLKNTQGHTVHDAKGQSTSSALLVTASDNTDEQPASNSDLSAPLSRRASSCTAVAFHGWLRATATCIPQYKLLDQSGHSKRFMLSSNSCPETRAHMLPKFCQMTGGEYVWRTYQHRQGADLQSLCCDHDAIRLQGDHATIITCSYNLHQALQCISNSMMIS